MVEMGGKLQTKRSIVATGGFSALRQVGLTPTHST